jgi:tape measure domain-containing protein
MSTSIDTRVVEMKFDNAAFERGIASTLKSLSNLERGLQLKGASNGLNEVNRAASRVSLGNIANGVQTIAGRFSNMGIVGVTALASIAHQAVATGAAMLKSLTTDPIKQGLQEYETNLNSIQTILANTGLEGKSGLGQVTKALDELNHYSDQTIYNFSEMARNIGTFTAAGVKLEPATAAIKGIANLAAISGSSSEQASSAMYQLSQAMAAGKATLVDWNSVVNAGMGGKVFQEALKETARVQGQNIDDIIKKNGSFRDSLQEGWLTTEVLTETLAKFTGDLTREQLKTMGYNEQQIAGIIKMGKTAQDAATKVKTVSQLINTLQEAASSGWAKTWQLMFGDFDEARTLFTNVNNVLGAFVSGSAEARNKVLGDWKALGGRTVLIKGISDAFTALISILKPIKEAFRQIFPPTTGAQLFALTKGFAEFTANLKIGATTANNLKRTFAGVFAIFSIAISVVKGIATAIVEVIKAFSGGSGGVLEFTGSIGDWLVALDKAIKSGDGFLDFFRSLGKAIAKPIEWLQEFAGYLKELASGIDDVGSAGLDRLGERFRPFATIGKAMGKAWSFVLNLLGDVWNVFEPLAGKFEDFFSGLGEAIQSAFGDVDYSGVLDGINTGLFAGLVAIFAGFLKNGLKFNIGDGILENISDALDGLTGTLGAMQTNLKANALLKIAGAIGLLAVSVIALSLVDPKRLTSAMTGLTVMFGQMVGAMKLLDIATSGPGFLKMPVLSVALIGLAIAIDLLALAVAKIGKLNWEDLAKGLVGVATLLASLALFTKFAAADKAGIASGAGLLLLAAGIKTLVSAAEDMAGLSWGEMAKGLTGVAALLTALALFTKLSVASKGGVAQGAGLLLLAAGIKILASAMEDLGQLRWDEIARGLVSMAGALAIMSLAIGLLPPSSLLSAAAIFVVAASLGMIADALGQMGGQSWEEIAKGLVTLAGSLAIIAGALYLMTAALPGAAALIVAAGALRLLAPVLLAFGEMSWGEILKGLTTLAGVFVVLGAAGILLAPVVPILIALGAAIALMGVGMLAAGAGLFLFSAGLTALAVAGAAGTAALVGMVKGLATLIPFVMTQLGLGIAAFAKTIATAGPQFTAAISTVLMSLMSAIRRHSPAIVATLAGLLMTLLNTMVKYVPQMTSAGVKIITGVLNGIAQNVPKMVTAATNVIVAFLNAISKNQPRVIQAGVSMIISFINGVASAIRNNSSAMGAAGANLGTAIVEGMARGLASGVGVIASKAREVASSALNAAKGVLGIRSPSKEFEKIGRYVNDGFRKGLDGNKGQIDTAFSNMRKQLLDFQKEQLRDIDRLEERLKKLRSARKKDNEEIRKTVQEIALARAEFKKANAAYHLVTKNFANEQRMLGTLANRYDHLASKIKTAQDRVADLTKTRDDYNRSIADQYSDLATPEKDQTLAEFIAAGKKQVQELDSFAQILQKLRGLGLNDEAYKDLLAKGPEALPFMRELLASGKAGINQVNTLNKQLDFLGGRLGKTAATNLYQAGVEAARGIVRGLQAQQTLIEKQMDAIAATMLRALKKALGIKSPSREMMEVGRYSVEGVVVGLTRYSGLVSKTAENIGHEAIDSLRKSISGIADVVTTDADFNPVIRPVLDLSEVEKKASSIGNILSAKPLSVDSSYAKAREAAAGYRSNELALQELELEQFEKASLSFTQINNSPRALSNAEIYRQTKNQLSVAKGALTSNAD